MCLSWNLFVILGIYLILSPPWLQLIEALSFTRRSNSPTFQEDICALTTSPAIFTGCCNKSSHSYWHTWLTTIVIHNPVWTYLFIIFFGQSLEPRLGAWFYRVTNLIAETIFPYRHQRGQRHYPDKSPSRVYSVSAPNQLPLCSTLPFASDLVIHRPLQHFLFLHHLSSFITPLISSIIHLTLPRFITPTSPGGDDGIIFTECWIKCWLQNESSTIGIQLDVSPRGKAIRQFQFFLPSVYDVARVVLQSGR